MKHIIYVGDVGRPNTALSIHAQNIAMLFNKIGYKTTFICDGNASTNTIEDEEGIYRYIYTKKYIKIPKISALEWLIDELLGWKSKIILKKIVRNQKPDFVIMYGYSGEKGIIKFCKKNSIPFLVERVDWFEKDDRNGLVEKFILQKQTDVCITKTDCNTDGVIAISPYLQKHYEKLSKPVIFIPPIFHIESNKLIKRYSEDRMIKLVYSGSVGDGKDVLSPVLQAIKTINHDQRRILIDIIGPTREQIEETVMAKELEQYGVYTWGRISNLEAKKIIQKADFSILLRKDKRYAKAGFSTKFAESMSLGVPVICTKVGGADSIITDMKDGILVNDNSVETIQSTLKNLLDKSSREILEMKENAYLKACDIFSIEQYIEKLNSFIERVEKEYE